MQKLYWEKSGNIFNPDSILDWNYTYAQVPWAIENEQFIRIYFTSRPPLKKGANTQISYTKRSTGFYKVSVELD